MSPPPFKPPAAAAASGRPAVHDTERQQYGEVLDGLERRIDAWKRECDRFLAAAVPVPPEVQRMRIEAQMRRLRDEQAMVAADRFRFGALEARFSSLASRFAKRLRDREEGPRWRAHLPERPAHDPRLGITVGVQPADEAVEALFRGLAQGGGEAPRFDLESFGRYLRQQVASIQQKTGCAEVQFRVAVEDGKVKLKAKPIRSESPTA
jgi:hypothetical protein